MSNYGKSGLAWVCWDLAEGDPELALLYAVAAVKLYDKGLTPRSAALQRAVKAAHREVAHPQEAA